MTRDALPAQKATHLQHLEPSTADFLLLLCGSNKFATSNFLQEWGRQQLAHVLLQFLSSDAKRFLQFLGVGPFLACQPDTRS
jgi:hypothetical protein